MRIDSMNSWHVKHGAETGWGQGLAMNVSAARESGASSLAGARGRVSGVVVPRATTPGHKRPPVLGLFAGGMHVGYSF